MQIFIRSSEVHHNGNRIPISHLQLRNLTIKYHIESNSVESESSPLDASVTYEDTDTICMGIFIKPFILALVLLIKSSTSSNGFVKFAR